MNAATAVHSDPHALRKVLQVQAPPEVAWRVFTTRMGSWWPLATHKIGAAPAVDAVVEPRVGGRWYERGADGSTCDWGTVLVWEPPARLVLSWDISAGWAFTPELKTEVEVRFVPEGRGTRVELEHRKLDRYGSHEAQMRETLGSEGGWSGLLQAFAGAAVRGA